MKSRLSKVLLIILGACVAVVAVSLLLAPLHEAYWDWQGYGGYDDESRVMKFILFVQVPVLLAGGAALGWWLHRKLFRAEKGSDHPKDLTSG